MSLERSSCKSGTLQTFFQWNFNWRKVKMWCNGSDILILFVFSFMLSSPYPAILPFSPLVSFPSFLSFCITLFCSSSISYLFQFYGIPNFFLISNLKFPLPFFSFTSSTHLFLSITFPPPWPLYSVCAGCFFVVTWDGCFSKTSL